MKLITYLRSSNLIFSPIKKGEILFVWNMNFDEGYTSSRFDVVK